MSTIDAPRVRAVARVGARQAEKDEPATLRRRRRPGHLGPVHVLQIVVLESALVLAVLAWRASGWHQPVLYALAALLPIVVFARFRGRWVIERLALRSRFRRRRAAARPMAADRRLTALRDIAPDLTVDTVESAGGTQLGVGRDAAGWFAVVALTPPRGLRGPAQSLPPFDVLARSLADAGQPGTVVQVVLHTTPGSTAGVGGPSVESYRELVRPFGGDTAAVGPVSVGDQTCWVTVRIESRAVAEAAITTPEAIAEVPGVLGALVRRVGNVLKRNGFSFRVLDGDGLLDALAHSLAVEVTPAGTERRTAQELWRGWRVAGLEHRSFWVRSWPKLDVTADFLAGLYQTPASMTSVSLTLVPTSGGAEVRGLVRIADRADSIGTAVTGLRAAAKAVGAEVFALDGEQSPAAYATAPTAVGTR